MNASMVATASAAPAACHQVLAAIFASLESHRLRWVLLRVPAGGLAAPRGDIDVLVHPDDLPAVAAIAARHDFARVPRPGASHHYLRYCELSDRWLWLHIVTSIGFGIGRPVPAEDNGWLAGRRVSAGIRLLHPRVGFWLLMWHCVSTSDAIALHHRSALTDGCEGAADDDRFARMFAGACGRATVPARIRQLVRRGEWASIHAYASAGRTRDSLARRVVRRARRTAGRVAAWRRGRGLTVAVLGPDGAGKSTLIAGLRATMPLPTHAIYMGLSGGSLRHARRLRVPGIVFAASAVVIWLRYLRARYHQERGRLVVFDRYVYDGFTPHPAKLTAAQRLSRIASGYLCPAPDLTLVLDAPGTVMYARKRSYTASTLDSWRPHFRALVDRVPDLHVIDATQSADAVRIAAATEIWRRYAKRWRSQSAGGAA